jgi:hypothetical protein
MLVDSSMALGSNLGFIQSLCLQRSIPEESGLESTMNVDPSIAGAALQPELPSATSDAFMDVDVVPGTSESLPVQRSQAGRLLQTTRVPHKFRDIPPEAPPLRAMSKSAPPIPSLTTKHVILHVRDSFRTGVNQFGILQEYLHRPSYDPNAFIEPKDLANFATEPTPSLQLNTRPPPPPPPWPFENMSKYLLMTWHNSGSSQKTEKELTRLAKEVIGAPEFNLEDLANFDAHRENKWLDNALSTEGGVHSPFSHDGWHEVAVEIEVPVPVINTPPRKFAVPGLHHRSIIQVIKETWGTPMSLQFHLTPFR